MDVQTQNNAARIGIVISSLMLGIYISEVARNSVES